MLPFIAKATQTLVLVSKLLDVGSTILGKSKPMKGRTNRTRQSRKPSIRRKVRMDYTAKGHELANAFARARTYLQEPPSKRIKGYEFYTIGGALRFAVGHDLRILRCALGLLSSRLDGKSVPDWLIANGVPSSEVTGLKGMKAIRVWKILWLEKLEAEFQDDQEDHTYSYEF